MKKIISSVAILLSVGTINAQNEWNSINNSNTSMFRNGNVGIGTNGTSALKFSVMDPSTGVGTKIAFGNKVMLGAYGNADAALEVSGTATNSSAFLGLNTNTTANRSELGFGISQFGAAIYSTKSGTGVAQPILFYTDGGSGIIERLRIGTNGRIGIGTNNPLVNFDIVESTPNAEASLYLRTLANASSKLFVANNLGSYGFMVDGSAKGHIVSNMNTSPHPTMLSWDGNGNFLFGGQTQSASIPSSKVTIATSQNSTRALSVINSGAETFKLFGNGTVVFSNYSTNGNDDVFLIEDALMLNKPSFKVKKNGFVYAREVTVTLNAFPDYVFDSDYKLPSLSEVRSHIKNNHKLINMPSAIDVEKNGANIGEIQKVTVEKLEEAYLYILQLEDKIEALSKKIEIIEKK